MVNGKPNLTFGDNQYTAPSRVQQRTGNNKIRNTQGVGGFESYLPVADYAPQARPQQRNGAPVSTQTAAPVGAQANAGLRQAPVQSMLNDGLKAPPQKSAPRFAQSPPAGYPGATPLSGQGGIMQNPAQRSGQPLQNALPLGGNSRC